MAELEFKPIIRLYIQACSRVIEQGLCFMSAQISYLQLMFLLSEISQPSSLTP